MGKAIAIAGQTVPSGTRQRVAIPFSRLPTETWLSLSVEAVNGARPGPCVWLSAAVHGDEIVGVEIIRQVLEKLDVESLRGAVIAVPIVNVFGFINQSRYLPDRRDLNRCFPGSRRGSLASQLACLFMREIVGQCTHGIDLHSGSNHRTNIPQVRGDLADPETRRCAEAFGVPVIVHAGARDGSLRQAAAKRGISVLVYEAGEPLRFDPEAIRTGVCGVLRVLHTLGMRRRRPKKCWRRSAEVTRSQWVRARRSGILRLQVQSGQQVDRKQSLGVIADALGNNSVVLRAPHDGLVLGHTNNPLVHRGDGVVHLAQVVSEVPDNAGKAVSGPSGPGAISVR